MLKLQNTIEKYLKKRGWHNNPPANIAKSISIESAELLEIFQWADLSAEDLKKNKDRLSDLHGEIADIFIYLTGMAIACDFDIEKVVLKKLKEVETKYPVKAVAGGDRDAYLALKYAHRTKSSAQKVKKLKK